MEAQSVSFSVLLGSELLLVQRTRLSVGWSAGAAAPGVMAIEPDGTEIIPLNSGEPSGPAAQSNHSGVVENDAV